MLMFSPVSVAIHKQRKGAGIDSLQEWIRLAAKIPYRGIIVEGDC